MAKIYIRKDGKTIKLLNPSEKGVKFAKELRSNIAYTNNGKPKREKDGSTVKTLSKEQRAYRSGYLDARKDSAKAWKASQKKKSNVQRPLAQE